MRALSLTQPWATLVAIGAKNIETRSWTTGYRGWLAIHAAKAMPALARELCFDEPFFSALLAAGDWVPDADSSDPYAKLNLPFGAIVAVVNLHKVGEIYSGPHAESLIRGRCGPVFRPELDFGDFTPGRFAWILTGGSALPEPILCRGAQRLWTVPTDIEARIREQVKL